VGDWQAAGSRIKAEWLGMLTGMAGDGDAPVKLPFVPLTVRGSSLRMVLADLLPIILGDNPSLLTLIRRDGAPLKAYAEDATSGVYERLEQLDVPSEATRDSLRDQAAERGVAVGVTKEADVRFFERFGEEPGDILDAFALLASAGAAALREGLMSFHPSIWAADLASRFALDVETTREILSRLLAPGTYGIGLVCSSGCVGLSVRAVDGGWFVEEAPPGDGIVTPGALCRSLVDRHGCGVAVAVSLPEVRALERGAKSIEDLVRARGATWEIVTRSGLEGLVRLIPSAVSVLELEKDLEECNVTFESIMQLVRGYVTSAISYAREKGIRLRVTDDDRVFRLVVDGESLRDAEADDGYDEARFEEEAVSVPLGVVRSALSLACSDPLQAVRDLVPREMIDQAAYATAVCVVECERPAGRLFLFGGPHEFFDRSWAGDACAVFVDARGHATVKESPGGPLSVSPDGRRVELAADGLSVALSFEPTGRASSRHGLNRFFGDEKVADWLPGLAIERQALRLAGGACELDGHEISCASGSMYLERGRGRLLRWPFGATWHYASWLAADGSCGSMVRSAPMLGASTPQWWRQLVERSTDGANTVPAQAVDHAIALEPGSPTRVVADAARVGEAELQYRVLSAVVVPFDEDGQVIFRLRCLCGDGAGLVEIPASLPGHDQRAAVCDVEFTERAMSFRAGGRELFSVETNQSAFLAPYAPPPAGLLLRFARWLAG